MLFLLWHTLCSKHERVAEPDPQRNQESLGSGESMVARLKLKLFLDSSLPIEWFSETFGLEPPRWATAAADFEKSVKLDHLEEKS